jgi:hypothetical protein
MAKIFLSHHRDAETQRRTEEMHFSVGSVSRLRGLGVGFAPKAPHENTAAATDKNILVARCASVMNLLISRGFVALRVSRQREHEEG